MQTKTEITMSFLISQKMKYLVVNLKTYAQNLYAENYNMLIDIKDDLKKWRGTLFRYLI